MFPVELAAALCHEVNRQYCQYLGDTSQPLWEEAPDWQKESARQGVLVALENPLATPESMHQNWYDHKAQEGWVYGPVKDPDKKEHPCMRPYEELPATQRTKDHLFLGIVRALQAGLQFELKEGV